MNKGTLRTNVFPEQFGQVENLISLYGFKMNRYFGANFPNRGRDGFFFLIYSKRLLGLFAKFVSGKVRIFSARG